VKQTFAVKPRGHAARVRRVRPLLAPAPVSQADGALRRREALEAGGEGLSVTNLSNGRPAP
jgi:hypothetical protein